VRQPATVENGGLIECQECHTVNPPNEYHPWEICQLRKRGYSPERIAAIVRDAFPWTNPDLSFRRLNQGPTP
jgi:hypothetical protein